MTPENQMKDAAKREHELARRLLEQEAGDGQSTHGMVAAVNRAFDRLYHHLSALIGMDGFDALAKRALNLATRECSYLGSVKTDAQPDMFRFQGLDASVVGREPAEVNEGIVAILGYFFWLLVTFVGDKLFDRLVQGVWPDATVEDKGPSSEGKQR